MESCQENIQLHNKYKCMVHKRKLLIHTLGNFTTYNSYMNCFSYQIVSPKDNEKIMSTVLK